jgi:hypothetical protein
LIDTFFVDVCPYLSSTENETFNFFFGFDFEFIFFVGCVGEDSMEMIVPAEILEGRTGERMAEKRFGKEQNHRFAEFAMDLTT